MTKQELTYILKGIDRKFRDAAFELYECVCHAPFSGANPPLTVFGESPAYDKIKELVDELTNLRAQYKHYYEQLTNPNVHSAVAGDNASVHSGQADTGIAAGYTTGTGIPDAPR